MGGVSATWTYVARVAVIVSVAAVITGIVGLIALLVLRGGVPLTSQNVQQLIGTILILVPLLGMAIGTGVVVQGQKNLAQGQQQLHDNQQQFSEQLNGHMTDPAAHDGDPAASSPPAPAPGTKGGATA